ncbi:MAG: HDOD domain-containing protein [Planctomycetaceae bacterium]
MSVNWATICEEWKGAGAAALPERMQFPMMPHSVVEFSHLSEKKSVTTEELAAVIERDSALVVEVLRYVNSAIVGLRWKVQSVARAMAAIGIRRTRTLLLTAALQQVLKGATSKFIHPLRFQRDNAERSLFAGETARLIGGDAETARTAGLLQDLLLPMLTDAYTETYRKFDPKHIGLVEFERQHFGWDHAALLAKLMCDWGFPEELVACVGLHHAGERVLDDAELARTSCGATAVASLLPDAMQQSFNGIDRLLTLQDRYPEFVWMEVAARVDTMAGEAGDIYGGRTELCGRLEKMALARLRRARLEAALLDHQVGNYAIEEKIGEGGMGVVYKARHCLLKRPAAVKLLQSTSFDRAAVQRFESEVQLTCQLTSPHTVAVYDYGVTPQGLLYYAMEHIEGLTLSNLVNRFGPLSDGRTIHLLIQACRSLQEAHDCGLIHRDIKPDNIMLTRRGGVCDVVKVLDFGLACTMDGKHQGVCGTPAFLAPEAIMSQKQPTPAATSTPSAPSATSCSQVPTCSTPAKRRKSSARRCAPCRLLCRNAAIGRSMPRSKLRSCRAWRRTPICVRPRPRGLPSSSPAAQAPRSGATSTPPIGGTASALPAGRTAIPARISPTNSTRRSPRRRHKSASARHRKKHWLNAARETCHCLTRRLSASSLLQREFGRASSGDEDWGAARARPNQSRARPQPDLSQRLRFPTPPA